jgi:RNA polymerase sigma factor (sigma-70 family)
MITLHKLSDEELVALYKNGKNKAFDALLKRYKDRIYSYIFFIVKNAERTEDIFQETFIKAIMTIKQGRYVESGKFPSWLTRIAHNLIIDSYRQDKSENLISNDDPENDVLNDMNLSDDSVEDEIIYNQIQDDLRQLIRYLPNNQQEVIRMRFYENLSFKEISDKTGVSINTALGRMRYAILNLRRMAEEKKIILTKD